MEQFITSDYVSGVIFILNLRKEGVKMATTIDKIKANLQDEILTETALDNIMSNYGFFPTDNEDEDIIKYSNSRSQIWIDIVRDDVGNIITDNIRKVTKEEGETEVDPIHSFEDLKRILDYFYNKKQYHHWFNALLQTLLGRRVGDITALKWSEFYLRNGEPRDRLKTLKEEKTNKIIGLIQTDYVKEVVAHYCEVMEINPVQQYNERIFCVQEQTFRKALKKASEALDIRYDISCHSFRKFFGNQIFKQHPNDPDRIKIIQYLFGHSSEEITRRYIGEIDEKMDRYMEDMSVATKAYLEGKDYEIDNSPVIHFKTQDLRKMVSDIYFRGKLSAISNDGKSDVDVINDLITEVEKIRIQ